MDEPVVIKWSLQSASLYFAGFTEYGAITWTLHPEDALWYPAERANRILRLIHSLESITVELEHAQ